MSRPASTHTRHYRIAAADTYTRGPRNRPAREGHLHAERAERELRTRLAAGERPSVVLVAPERATRAKIGQDGHVSKVFAWAPPAAGDIGLRDFWTHVPHVTADLDVHAARPDFASDLYAANGSVWVTSGRIRRLAVSQWLAPVAGQLVERYGIPVDVDLTPELPPCPPIGVGAVLGRSMLPDALIARLLALPRPTRRLIEPHEGYRPPILAAEPPWGEWGDLISNTLVQAGKALGAPINYCGEFGVLEYPPGYQFNEHTDYVDENADTWDRTVSLSLLLNEPGRDFRGGQFELGGKDMDLHRGDLVAFTARTPHAVRKVTAGRRLVLVAFGEYRRDLGDVDS
ncbi:hypothetical protein GCM10009827_083870 [Dactylosporangium maewongense]|uniref:Fe2OG dioxygenase domain-containing protein n=1 Tax=Dactylosporangium maewongense TaxID=634393 RepID=A0ABN2C390_9ACTN